jgi:hypothetical protein
MITLNGVPTRAEKAAAFSQATNEAKKAAAISTKRVSIAFRSGSAELDENAKYILIMSF